MKEIAIHKRMISKRKAGARQAFEEFKQKRIKFVEKTHDVGARYWRHGDGLADPTTCCSACLLARPMGREFL